MFGFEMMGNYDNRKVGRNDFPWGMISTAYVTDGDKDYETAVLHEEYNDGKMVIVENYDTKEEANAGHTKWVKKMTGKRLPAALVECNNSGIAQMCAAFGGEKKYPRKKSA